MSRQSEIRARLEGPKGELFSNAPSDLRYLLDRLEVAEGLLHDAADWAHSENWNFDGALRRIEQFLKEAQ